MEPLIHGVIFGRTILIVSSDAKAREVLAGQFQSFQCHILLASDAKEATNHIHTAPKIDVVIMEIHDSISEAFEFVDSVVQHGTSTPPIFLVTDKIDMHFDEAFYRGVEAIFFKPMNLAEMLKGIAYSLEVMIDRAERQHERRRLRRARLEFTDESTGLTSSGHVMNISKGGMYVSSMYNHPTALQSIKFKLVCDFDGPLELSGRGLVKWSRASTEYGRPPGFGIEFKDLSVEAQAAVDKILQGG
jgi:CheY-like chemotaxis protein